VVLARTGKTFVMPVTACALNCSLNRSSGEASSTHKLLNEVLAALETHGVAASGIVRVADHNVLAGVTSLQQHP
jgi:hypothetical protein